MTVHVFGAACEHSVCMLHNRRGNVFLSPAKLRSWQPWWALKQFYWALTLQIDSSSPFLFHCFTPQSPSCCPSASLGGLLSQHGFCLPAWDTKFAALLGILTFFSLCIFAVVNYYYFFISAYTTQKLIFSTSSIALLGKWESQAWHQCGRLAVLLH